MHLASINTQEEQKQIEQHIQSLGKPSDYFCKHNANILMEGFGHEHFWTSGTDQAEEGK